MRKDIIILGAIYIAGALIVSLFAFGYDNWIFVNDSKIEYQIYLNQIDMGYSKTLEIFSQQGYVLQAKCLMTTYIPALLQQATHINPEVFYRLYTVLLVALFPVSVYLVASLYLNKKWALFCAAMGMVQVAYLKAPELSRAVIAISFFALTLWAINRNRKRWTAYIAVVVFPVLLVFAHYTTTIIGVALLTAMFLVMLVKKDAGRGLAAVAIVVMVALSLEWYGPAVYKTTYHIIRCGVQIDSIWSLLSLDAEGVRNSIVQAAFGNPHPDGDSSFQHNLLIWVLSWVMVLSACAGVVVVYVKKLLPPHIIIMAGCAVLGLTAYVLLPIISRNYGVERLWLNSFVVLCPMLAVSIRYLTQWTKRLQPVIVVSYVLALGILNYNFETVFNFQWGLSR